MSRWLKRLFIGSAVVVVVLVLLLQVWLRASLPQLDGEIALDRLSGPVLVARDALGVVTVRGATRLDVARATGFVHAQDRFFQMDASRRAAAGELSALVGEATLERDRARRLHGSRGVARTALAQASSAQRALLQAYADGVNDGLASLAVSPPEYRLRRPDPWRSEDTMLVVLAMFYRLNDETAARDRERGRLYQALDERLAAFLLPAESDWDAALDGSVIEPTPMPGPDACDLRGAPPASARRGAVYTQEVALGSNAWALDGAYTASGVPLLANDMHLKLPIPNLCYRMRLQVIGEPGGARALDVTGVTLPGTPAVVAGSNGDIAWGFTNSYGDWSDRIVLELDPEDPRRYRTPAGYAEFQTRTETIEVAGGEPLRVDFQDTVWGPVIEQRDGVPAQALRWLGHLPEAVNMGLVAMERARNVEQALAIAHRTGAPPQNFQVVDRNGEIAWSILGRIPRRVGYAPDRPASWADGAGWEGWVEPADYPLLRAPANGRIWTANSRVVGGAMLDAIGDGGYYPGARATQIRDRLMLLNRATPADMLALQLDDRALFQARWRDLLREVLDQQATRRSGGPVEARAAIENWGARASVDSVGYRLVREFRRHVEERLLPALLAGCAPQATDLSLDRERRNEQPLWALVSQRPAHLLPGGYDSWQALLLAAFDDTLADCAGAPLAECTWGRMNHVTIAHPFAADLGILARFLTVQDGPLPGDDYMPRVQRPDAGASERFAVSPGLEGEGYFHMPGGQSGHPLSAYFDAGHEAWAEGRPLPFLPGSVEHSLTLVPVGR